MPDEIKSPTLSKTDIKTSNRGNVIPITSISDLGNVVGDIQNQLMLLMNKLNSDVSPEFKALMEGYVNKANESEELKVNLENVRSSHEELKIEVTKVRETNRNLIQELQIAREILSKLEQELNTHQELSIKAEEEYKEKFKHLTEQAEKNENVIKVLEEERAGFNDAQENLRQELLDQKFAFHQKEQELTINMDNFKKQAEEYEALLKEQSEKLELRTKEAQYKDALLNQLIKKATTEKLKIQELESDELGNLISQEKQQKKKKAWFCK